MVVASVDGCRRVFVSVCECLWGLLVNHKPCPSTLTRALTFGGIVKRFELPPLASVIIILDNLYHRVSRLAIAKCEIAPETPEDKHGEEMLREKHAPLEGDARGDEDSGHGIVGVGHRPLPPPSLSVPIPPYPFLTLIRLLTSTDGIILTRGLAEGGVGEGGN